MNHLYFVVKRFVWEQIHPLFCLFGLHWPVRAIVYAGPGIYKIGTLYWAGVPILGDPMAPSSRRYYIPPGADPTGQQDSTEAFQVALDAACNDKRLWCEFCEKLLEPQS